MTTALRDFDFGLDPKAVFDASSFQSFQEDAEPSLPAIQSPVRSVFR